MSSFTNITGAPVWYYEDGWTKVLSARQIYANSILLKVIEESLEYDNEEKEKSRRVSGR